MDYFNFVVLVPALWALMSMFSLWVWSQHRQHVYLLGLAAAWFCAGLAHGSALLTQLSSAGARWSVAIAAWLCAVLLAQAMAMRFGRGIQSAVVGCITALILLGGALTDAAVPHPQWLAVGLALILAHILPMLWRLTARHSMERVLLAGYSGLCAVMLLVPVLASGGAVGWAERSLLLPVAAGVLTVAMAGCVWAESPAHWYAQRDRDGLTGLFSRLSFEQACSTRPAEQQISFVVLCDIDHFPHLRHRLGAAAADEVLRQFAQLLKSSVRTGDLVARMGGEEFAMALRHIDQSNAQVLVQRIMGTLARQTWAGTESIGPLTASFGLAMVRENESLEMALHRADVLLCQAKDAGGNRVAVEELTVPAGRHSYRYSH